MFRTQHTIGRGSTWAYTVTMHNFLYLMIILAMVATLIALVRGIVAFLQTSREELEGGQPNLSGLRQNRMMRLRIAFQALAVLLVVLFLLVG